MSCGHRLCMPCSGTCKCGVVTKQDDKKSFYSITCLKCFCAKQTESYSECDCMHLCDTCYFYEVRKGVTNCRVCNNQFKKIQQTLNKEAICEVHQKSVHFTETVKLKCMHDHCRECWRGLIDLNRCLVCEKTLVFNDLIMIRKPERVQCENCRSSVDRSSLAQQKCCSADICSLCIQENSRCPFCE